MELNRHKNATNIERDISSRKVNKSSIGTI